MPKSILIVEDDEELAKSFEEFLGREGYDVARAADGYDALEKVASGSYNLITMDLKMPRMGGIQATELLRVRRVSTPVIVISAWVREFEEKLGELDVRHILRKPVGLDELLEAVQDSIGDGKAS